MLLLLPLLLLAACGYEPLHGRIGAPAGGTPAQMERVVIDPVKVEIEARERLLTTTTGGERVGQLIRNALQDNLAPRGKPKEPLYRLKIEVTEYRQSSIISVTDDATRISIQMVAVYRLEDWRSEETVYSGRSRAISAYNILPADYGNIAAERDTRARLASELAQNIRQALGVFFRRQTAG
ncbi:MAG: hypothetical protein KIT20_02360 [Alphaproteobacteria bacterium]|nr:hypothetical protein [Alphaproteobacteria bacterium]